MIAKILLLLALIVPAHGADLRVLSWNAFMLPKPIKFSNQSVRTEVISYALSDGEYDLIFFQEAFMGSFREKVGNDLKENYPHQYYLGNNRFLYPFFGSGVFILSKKPFTVLDKVYFDKCGAADCFAAKGSVLIETKIPNGKTVQFAVTHLQATEKLGAVRLRQMGQINKMLQKHKKENIPQLLVGDLNTDAKEPEFEKGLDLLGMNATQLTGEYDHTNVIPCYKKPTHQKEWIDHMWVDKKTQLKDSSISARAVDYEFKGQTCMASDHLAIEGNFTFAD